MWNIILSMTLCAAIVSVVTFGVFNSLFHCGRGMIVASYYFFAFLWGAVTVVVIPVNPYLAIVPAVICGVVLRFATRKKRRIAFAGANLKVCRTLVRCVASPPPPLT